jgi:hypothetical protein
MGSNEYGRNDIEEKYPVDDQNGLIDWMSG